MAQQQEGQLDQEKFCCSICLDLLKDPVSVPCGHNYCSKCIDRHWNQRNQKGKFSCPQCRQTFNPRPDLKKNIMLADMMDILKNTQVQVVPSDLCYAGPGDVACDFCSGRKQKAVKTCLQCLVSYCDAHLQPHYQSPAFKNHKLIKASSKLEENICSRHAEVKKLFCRTDQQCICYLCCMEEHKGHDMTSAAAERTQRQKELDTSQENIQQRIHESEEDVKVLHQELKSINNSADRAVEDSDTVFTELTTSIKGRRSEVRKLIRDQQKREVSCVEELRKRVEQIVTTLRWKRKWELVPHCHFLDSSTGEYAHPVSSWVRPLRYFEDVTEAVSKMRGKLEDVFKEDGTEFLRKDKPEDFFNIKLMKGVLVMILFFVIALTHPIGSSVHPQGTPGRSRAEFLQYSCPLTMDRNTANILLGFCVCFSVVRAVLTIGPVGPLQGALGH